MGELDPIPHEYQLVRILTPQPDRERENARAVSNAINRVSLEGVEQTKLGKEYAQSLSRPELTALVSHLWEVQNGRCVLTGQLFDLRTNEDSGQQADRVSLDRIDNSIGYAEGNVQLVTQFANRARGTLSIEGARRRLVQFNNKAEES